jgi:hypothetical protein
VEQVPDAQEVKVLTVVASLNLKRDVAASVGIVTVTVMETPQE